MNRPYGLRPYGLFTAPINPTTPMNSATIINDNVNLSPNFKLL